MAEPYRERLATMLRVIRLSKARGVRLECRHFFSGAALYANGTICASLTPVGFALKLPEESRAALLPGRAGQERIRRTLGRDGFRTGGDCDASAREHSVRHTHQGISDKVKQ